MIEQGVLAMESEDAGGSSENVPPLRRTSVILPGIIQKIERSTSFSSGVPVVR